jgi:hypothetical protein
LLVGEVISGAVGRTELRGAAASGGLGAGVAGAAGVAPVGGPIEIAGIGGRDKEAAVETAGALGPLATPADDALGPPGECMLGPTSMGRVTTTAGGSAGGAGAGATFGVAAAGFAAAAAGGLLAIGWVAAEGFGAAFADDGAGFGCGAPGCGEGPGPRPSFGGRCIDGPSSAVLVDGASVSPFGLPEKSLEKTLIAEDQP